MEKTSDPYDQWRSTEDKEKVEPRPYPGQPDRRDTWENQVACVREALARGAPTIPNDKPFPDLGGRKFTGFHPFTPYVRPELRK